MTNKKAPLSQEAKDSIKEAVKEPEPLAQGFYDRGKLEFVPKFIFSDAQIKEIADGLNMGRDYVFAKGVSRNTQYNVRKKLKEQYPNVRYDIVIVKGRAQTALFSLHDAPKSAQ